MNRKDILTKINKRKKELNKKEVFSTFLLLLLPSLLVTLIFSVIIGLVIYAWYVSLVFLMIIALVLPMFYVVEKRVRTSIYKVGKKNFNYVDGYSSFFANKQLGLFGVITSISYAIMLGLLVYLIFYRYFDLFCSPFTGASEAYEKILTALQSETTNSTVDIITTNIPSLIKPGIVYFSTIFFLPLFFIIFFFFNNNLSDHYLATVVLPDIDLNLTAAQSRGLSKASFKRYIRRNLPALRLITNWPIYVSFILVYVGLTFLFVSFSYTNITNIFLALILVCIVPIVSLFLGLLLNYECLINEYIMVDELSVLLHSALPKAIKDSIRLTYKNPGYVHGEESVIKGEFFPEDNYVFSSTNLNNNNANATKQETYNAYTDKEDVKGGVFDFSDVIKEKKDDTQIVKPKVINPKNAKKTLNKKTNKTTKTPQKKTTKKE